ncbi:anthranilate synthase component II [Ochrobactrum teleogrylli]|uniref:Aminodeoxychorismate/anthranilate synthase component II n=1 Tax=Ochrobactrum teleogrylli TaxID=2479765 RepID=A0ABY2Y6U3_9HYPH|nr:aminodeoxychorismate/anthranilate synthase component II [[Ochrobactrum] teleogrylli]TNV16134.1 aminodeoxychorismate/anthranilate synthase component II [[Ochrobactrum] teleogrylli]
MRVLLIDAYDSFVYIVKNYIDVMGHDSEIVRWDHVRLDAVVNYDAIILGPGPGHPTECGYLDIIRHAEGKVPIFGICLGMQAIAQFYGLPVVQAEKRLHGKISTIRCSGTNCFSGLPNEFKVTRYHSLIADDSAQQENSPLKVTARSLEDNYIMGLKHQDWCIEGVQFHPESICSEYGYRILENFFFQSMMTRLLRDGYYAISA